jgi:prepilin-type N-terminal cleavage/methylation domain-containing protein
MLTAAESGLARSRELARRRGAGFTMIELIVAMTIIAVMAAAGLGIYSGIKRKSNDNVAIGLADQLAGNLQHYAALNGGAYPAGIPEDSWSSIVYALGSYAEFGTTAPAIISGPGGGLLVYTDAAGSTFQIEFTAAGGTGTVYCRDPNGLATLGSWSGGAGPWAGCP